MKLNSKGMTLLELLVSIVLIGMVLVFIFGLLVDIRDETDSNDFVYNNQINRTEVIYTIQNELNKYTLIGIEDTSAGDRININFHFKKGEGTASGVLSAYEEDNKYFIKYVNALGENNLWEMKNAIIDKCGKYEFYKESGVDQSDNYYFKLNLYIYNANGNERNSETFNNSIDDIEINYANKKENLVENSSYISSNNTVSKKTNNC